MKLKTALLAAFLYCLAPIAGALGAAPSTATVTGTLYRGTGQPAPNVTVIFNTPQQIVGGSTVAASVFSTRTNSAGVITPITLVQNTVVQITVGAGMVVTGVVPGASTADINQVLAGSVITLPPVEVNGVPIASSNNVNFQNGNGILITNPSGSNIQIAADATSANTASKIVQRDGSGNFAAGTITADLTGTASIATSATTLAKYIPPQVTVATLPSSPEPNRMVTVTNGSTATSCETGGGSFKIDCRWNSVSGHWEPSLSFGAGIVTAVTATSPITSTGGTAPIIACATCAVTGSPLSQFAATTSAQLRGVLSDETGTGVAVFGTSPTIATPTLTVPVIVDFSSATHTHQNAAGGGTLDAAAIAAGTVAPARLGSGSGGATKFLREDSTFQTIPGGGDALTSSPLSQFAATTSAQFAGVISDESGTGLVILQTSPTIITPTIASFVNATHDHTNAAGGGQLTAASLSTAKTGTGSFVLATSPTIVTPTIASFVNANHNHTDSAGGGLIPGNALSSYIPNVVTVATLPGSPINGQEVTITDALTSGSCTPGAGTNTIRCQWSAAASQWIPAVPTGAVPSLATLTGVIRADAVDLSTCVRIGNDVIQECIYADSSNVIHHRPVDAMGAALAADYVIELDQNKILDVVNHLGVSLFRVNEATGALLVGGSAGTAGQCLKSQGAASPPQWTTC